MISYFLFIHKKSRHVFLFVSYFRWKMCSISWIFMFRDGSLSLSDQFGFPRPLSIFSLSTNCWFWGSDAFEFYRTVSLCIISWTFKLTKWNFNIHPTELFSSEWGQAREAPFWWGCSTSKSAEVSHGYCNPLHRMRNSSDKGARIFSWPLLMYHTTLHLKGDINASLYNKQGRVHS